MEAYTEFALVYDLFMDNVPYEAWCGQIRNWIEEYGIKENIVLDLGCGTGKMARIMAGFGYDMIGIDYSPEMLDVAREQEMEREDGILYLCQDMRQFELYGTVGACYCSCDSLNYMTSEEDLLSVFRLVNNYLYPGGLFVFDLNTPWKYENQLADNTFAETRAAGSFIWENYYDRESRINEYDLTLFIREDILDGESIREDTAEKEAEDTDEQAYFRFREHHFEKSYDLETVKRLLEEAGLAFIAAFDGYSGQPLRADSERMTILARETGKKEQAARTGKPV